jgi:dolichyl-diphosphooligosaccharide--protein glycosyltransferase
VKMKGKESLWVGLTLIGIGLLIGFLTVYFNFTSSIAINQEGESLAQKFYFSGPDPYHHGRNIERIVETGHHPYWLRTKEGRDPLLNYPLRLINPRPPLFDWSIAGIANLLTPIIGNKVDAVGYAMQFSACLWGALLVIPVYFIAVELFKDRRIGLLASLLVALIPLHLTSGHGCAYALADHDSFVLFFNVIAFYFFLKMLKSIKAKEWVENWRRAKSIKEGIKSCFKANLIPFTYASLAGLAIATIGLAWKGFQLSLAILTIYLLIQMLVDKCRKKDSTSVFFAGILPFIPALLVPLPYYLVQNTMGEMRTCAFMLLALIVVGLLLIPTKRLPALLIIPIIGGVAAIALSALWVIKTFFSGIPALSPLVGIANTLFGGLPYVQKTKIYLTIAEAASPDFSSMVMGFGPILYWLPFVGIVLLLIQFGKRWRPETLFVLTWVGIDLYLSVTSARFLNNLVPMFAILAAWIIGMIVKKVNFKGMIKAIRSKGGWKGIKKGVKVRHLLVIALLIGIFFPNGYLALDAAVPFGKEGRFGAEGAYGLSFYKEKYWVDALSWLAKQDSEIADPADRPGFIAWWDYGFYEAMIGEHPTVADNFQSGVEAAANFHTSTDETQATAVLITRILEGHLCYEGLSKEVKNLLEQYLGRVKTKTLVDTLQNPTHAKSFGKPIGAEYNKNLSEEYKVRAQNAKYHDAIEILSSIGDEPLTQLYFYLQKATGYQIRYYGVAGFDLGIFNIFPFLADKSTYGVGGGMEDDYIKTWYVGYYLLPNRTRGPPGRWSPDELNRMSEEEKNWIELVSTQPEYKPDFFNTTFYRTYIGLSEEDFLRWMEIMAYYRNLGKSPPRIQLPSTFGMKHWVAKYFSPYPYPGLNTSAVVIAEYYEGAFINGTVKLDKKPFAGAEAWVVDENGIPHDHRITDSEGKFSLIAPPGNITISIINEGLVIANQTFDKSGELAPITEAEARRNTKDFDRSIEFDISMASLKFNAFFDKDDDGSYDKNKGDELLSGVKITIKNKTKATHHDSYAFPEVILGVKQAKVELEEREPTEKFNNRIEAKPKEELFVEVPMRKIVEEQPSVVKE